MSATQEITITQRGDNRKEIKNKDYSLSFLLEKTGGMKQINIG